MSADHDEKIETMNARLDGLLGDLREICATVERLTADPHANPQYLAHAKSVYRQINHQISALQARISWKVRRAKIRDQKEIVAAAHQVKLHLAQQNASRFIKAAKAILPKETYDQIWDAAHSSADGAA